MVFCLSFRAKRGSTYQQALRSGITQAARLKSNFWKNYPALQFSLLFLCGVGFSWPMLVLWVLCFYRKNIILSLLISLLGFGFFYWQTPSYLEEGFQKKGTGYFIVESIQKVKNNTFSYKGKFFRFYCEDNTTLKNIPCKIYMRGKKRPPGNYHYFISGTLSKKTDKFFSFKQDKSAEWQARKKVYNLVELRFQTKEKLKKHLSKKIKNANIKYLCIALTTGDVESSFLRYVFSRIGLSHILAISGFHFGLFVGFLALLLRKILPQKALYWTLLFISFLYLSFIGVSPSVLRAWVIVTLFILSKILGKVKSSLNLVGVSLLINLLLSPTDIFHLGFQFSYLSYLAIILFYTPTDAFFSQIIKSRNPKDLPLLSRPVYHFLVSFRKAFSLNVAVHLVITPVLLYHFCKVPIYTLFYNLFIPPSIGILMYLLVISLVMPVNWIYFLIEGFSKMLLKIIVYPPFSLEFFIRFKGLPYWFVLFYLEAILLIVIFHTAQKMHRNLTSSSL
ncbi:MAG: hypothetical protein COT84_06780 [Chlamydiae bacterium CG10_big_fil_rev_8_21_14_0_10_35_9]|nr:MAG: hypothetical protein COT84_06780 [Chlamydiae bacterium CG10_big_fil_rev_8_21_14_0_10_35_9]